MTFQRTRSRMETHICVLQFSMVTGAIGAGTRYYRQIEIDQMAIVCGVTTVHPVSVMANRARGADCDYVPVVHEAIAIHKGGQIMALVTYTVGRGGVGYR